MMKIVLAKQNSLFKWNKN